MLTDHRKRSAAGNTSSVGTDGIVRRTGSPAASPNPTAVGTSFAVSAVVDDTNTGNSAVASAEVTIDAGVTWVAASPADGAWDEPSELVTVAMIAPLGPDVYDVCVRGTDEPGNLGAITCAPVAVYDPSGGFVTGGGWIDSPAGAYVADPTRTGRAVFGFVSKYQKGATTPTGNTQFQFRDADLNFHSTAYEWLVVSGSKAQYKGTGTINGVAGYGFLLTATDGDVDRLRMKIWERSTGTVIYDNQVGDSDGAAAADAIENGSVVIHAPK